MMVATVKFPCPTVTAVNTNCLPLTKMFHFFHSPVDLIAEAYSVRSLQHLDDADSVEFEVKDEEPVVKHTIKGKVGWESYQLLFN